MRFTKMVSSLFYRDLRLATTTFVDCLEFRISHEDLHSPTPFCIVEKDGISIMIFKNDHYANLEHPEIRLVTDDIREVYKKISAAYPQLLHPNLAVVEKRPWGALEFAMLDGQIGIRFQQW